MKNTEIKTYKKLTYAISVPDNFDESKKYPAVIFLHGSGTRGTDPNILLGNSYFKLTAELGYNAVSFAPQCYTDSWFDIHEQLIDFAEFVSCCTFVDSDRLSLMGASMGGYATWQLAISRPSLFSAIVPICGGGTYWNAYRLCSMGVWAVHGAEDDAVFPEESVKMVRAIENAGGHPRLTILDGVGHNSWEYAYSSREIHDFMFSCRRSSGGVAPEDTYTDSAVFG